MTQRIISALVLVALIALPIWQGGFLFVSLVLAVALLALLEFYRMIARSGYPAIIPLAGLALLLIIYAAVRDDIVLLQSSVSVLVMGGLLWELASPATERKLRGWALTLVGIGYIGWPAGMMVSVRLGTDGLLWILLLIIGTSTCDIMAYTCGRIFGRRLFAPRYSPKKTWEGVFGGVASSFVVTITFGLFFHILPVWQAGLLGLLIGIAAVGGDLAESMIKRRIGVKDSSHLIPGHGGLLDRLDSLLFSSTVVYFFMRLGT